MTDVTADLIADRDPKAFPECTGIYVRAIRHMPGKPDRWDSVDICQLSRKSLVRWMRSRGGENTFAESVVLHLLGHGNGEE